LARSPRAWYSASREVSRPVWSLGSRRWRGLILGPNTGCGTLVVTPVGPVPQCIVDWSTANEVQERGGSPPVFVGCDTKPDDE
jgi:hypothetical protein